MVNGEHMDNHGKEAVQLGSDAALSAIGLNGEGTLDPANSAMASNGAADSADVVGIVGLGLIGGSLAQRLVANGVRVVAWNHRPNPYAAAQAAGIECVGSLQDVALAKPKVLMLCNPLKAMPSVLAGLQPVLDREATTLSDVGSVKAMVRGQVEAAGLGDCYVGAHPMCGNEHSGFDAADSTLFDDALWAVTVDGHTDYQRFYAVARLITQDVGCRFIAVDDGTHDRAAAMISHAPHAVATALINGLVASSDRSIAASLAAGSWRDMTRVALTDPNRTRAMIEENAVNVEQLLRLLAGNLTDFADMLEAGDERAMEEFFAAGQPFRDFKAEQLQPGGKQSLNQISSSVHHVDPACWQDDFLDLARAGEHVVAVRAPYEVEVQRRSSM